MAALLSRGCGCLLLLVMVLIVSCSAIVNAVLPPLSGRGPDGSIDDWKAGILMRVTARDELELRAGPGEGQPVIARVPQAGTRVVTLGQAYRRDGTVWIDVHILDSGPSGWVRRADVVPGD